MESIPEAITMLKTRPGPPKSMWRLPTATLDSCQSASEKARLETLEEFMESRIRRSVI